MCPLFKNLVFCRLWLWSKLLGGPNDGITVEIPPRYLLIFNSTENIIKFTLNGELIKFHLSLNIAKIILRPTNEAPFED